MGLHARTARRRHAGAMVNITANVTILRPDTDAIAIADVVAYLIVSATGRVDFDRLSSVDDDRLAALLRDLADELDADRH